MPEIISRAQWGATPWRGQPYSVAMSERAWFLVHYHGGKPRNDRGDANAKEIEAIHLNNGWSGIGYNFIVGQDGVIREGRGWGLVGAHCPGHNRDGIGVYVAVGGDQEPTPEALASVRWLYDEACRKAGHTLVKSYHGFDYPTSCPGGHLRAWVVAGMGVKAAAVVVGVKPAKVAQKVKQVIKRRPLLVVDGVRGPATTRALQRWVGTTPDGIWGPKTRRALQRKLGVAVDGHVGPITIKALQRRVGARQDGLWGPATTRALQRYLNKGGWAR